jgi:hypothetical protein
MTTSPDVPEGTSAPSPLDSVFLDGHTVEELSDYLDHGRVPRNESIESSPGAQHALAALSRLRSFAPQVLQSEADVRDSRDDSWIRRILDQIGVQAHAGRDIPISHVNPTARLYISEGAVRSLVREQGDALEGIIVEKTSLEGEIEQGGAPITVLVEVSLFADFDRDTLLHEFRTNVLQTLHRNTQLTIDAVTVRVHNDDLTDENLVEAEDE